MFAIAEFTGKQVKVEKDMLVEIPHTRGEVGDIIETDKVLLVQNQDDVKVGSPYLPSTRVKASIYAHDRGKKSIARIYKRRKQFKKTWGFRKEVTLIKILEVIT